MVPYSSEVCIADMIFFEAIYIHCDKHIQCIDCTYTQILIESFNSMGVGLGSSVEGDEICCLDRKVFI